MKKLFIFITTVVLMLSGCSTPSGVINNSLTSTVSTTTTSISKDTTQPPTTFTTVKEDNTFNIKLSFSGDCMLASYKGEYTSNSFNKLSETKDPSYFFDKVSHIFKSDDFTLVNLENVFTDRPLKEVYKDYSPAYWYKSPTKNANILKVAGIEGVSIDNNHTYDYGKEGQSDTIDAIKSVGIDYGIGGKIIYYTKNDFTVAFICDGLWATYHEKYIIDALKEASEVSDYQVVFFHGGTEKVHEPEQWKIDSCHKIVDAGADLVLGCHPHVLQPREVYNGVEIIYSLGNFCYGGSSRPENATIIYQMNLTIDNHEVKNEISTIIPCYVYTGSRNNYQPTPIDPNDENYDKILSFIGT